MVPRFLRGACSSDPRKKLNGGREQDLSGPDAFPPGQVESGATRLGFAYELRSSLAPPAEDPEDPQQGADDGRSRPEILGTSTAANFGVNKKHPGGPPMVKNF